MRKNVRIYFILLFCFIKLYRETQKGINEVERLCVWLHSWKRCPVRGRKWGTRQFIIWKKVFIASSSHISLSKGNNLYWQNICILYCEDTVPCWKNEIHVNWYFNESFVPDLPMDLMFSCTPIKRRSAENIKYVVLILAIDCLRYSFKILQCFLFKHVIWSSPLGAETL